VNDISVTGTSIISQALQEFQKRGELTLKNTAKSLLITDTPLQMLRDWNGFVLTAHRGITHPRCITKLPADFITDETLVCVSPLGDIARYQIALALSVTSGLVVAIAENRRGAERLAKLIGKESHPEMQVLSRSHCRMVIAEHEKDAGGDNHELIAQPVAGFENIVALPGVFSCERADRGTEMLLRCARNRLDSRREIKTVLDLGCGCGVLGIAVLEHAPHVAVDFVDVDFRAVESTKINLVARGLKTDTVFWADALTAPMARERYDLVLLNPPFHAHGQEQRELGRKIIQLAGRYAGGELYIVGNSHLGYGAFLQEQPLDVAELETDRQFTVWSARRKAFGSAKAAAKMC